MEHRPVILSELDAITLEFAARGSSYPKWNSMCLFRLLSMPTLDGLFIAPHTPAGLVRREAGRFAEKVGVDRIMIRSDGGRETGQYFRGGSSPELAESVGMAHALSSQGRAVMLLEPTDRFSNLLSVNVRADATGDMIVEVLGPGYDVSDLNRGGIAPELTFEVHQIDWDSYERPRWNEYTRTVNRSCDQRRIRRRLDNIGRHALPSLGLTCPRRQEPSDFAERWLRDTGHTHLWAGSQPKVSQSQLDRWFDDMFMVTTFRSVLGNWTTLVLSGSQLSASRFVWWDVVDPAQKYHIG